MTENTLLEFPCDFPIKVIGENTATFIADIIAITKKHCPEFDENHLKQKESEQSKYLSITLHIIATSKEMIDALYQELSQQPAVKMVL